MYQAYIPLTKKRAIEAIKILCSGEDITRYHDKIGVGSINYEQLGNMTALKLELIIIIEGKLRLLSLNTHLENGSEDASGLYKMLEKVYQSMRARHRERITPFGIVGPSEDIEISYYAVEQNANGLGDTKLKPVDISHICLN